jgi:hypothetical protein
MNSLNPQPTYITSAEIIVERLRVSIKTRGLEATIHDFEGMERLLSGLPFWPEVKAGAEIVFAEERERLEQLELARAKATAPNVYQFMPAAQSGMNVNSPGNFIGKTINNGNGNG